MSLLNLGEDTWLREFESCEKLYRDIMGLLSQRQREPKTTTRYSQLSASIRLYLKQYHSEVTQLKQKLDQISKSQTITYEEAERRRRQVEMLKSKGVHLQTLFDEPVKSLLRDREQLIGAEGISNWRDESGIGNENIDEVRSQQKRLLEEQERGLENLSKIISRQKDIANTISSEVDLHNEILDDLGGHIDKTDARISNETKQVTVIDRKDKTCVYWVIIVLLFISIITVAAI